MFFEARRLSYSKFIGMARSAIRKDYSELDSKEFYSVASEVVLLSSNELRPEIVALCNHLIENTTNFSYFLPIETQKELIRELKKIELSMKGELGIK